MVRVPQFTNLPIPNHQGKDRLTDSTMTLEKLIYSLNTRKFRERFFKQEKKKLTC